MRSLPDECRHRVAIVVPNLTDGRGGVPTVARFLFRVLKASTRYAPELISVPAASTDESSVRLADPGSWFRGVATRSGRHRGEPFVHVGAVFPEVELLRYRPTAYLRRLLRGFDLVQIVAGSPAWVGVARGCGRPVVLQTASLMRSERRSLIAESTGFRRRWYGLMTGLGTRLEARYADRADLVFVENRLMHEWMQRRLGSERVLFRPPGVDTARFTPPQPPGRGVDDLGISGRYVLSVGRLDDPRKNVGLILRSFAQVDSAAACSAQLVLVGSSIHRTEVDARARALGVRSRLKILDNVDEDDLIRLYQNACVFVLGSDEEGLGMVLLEAMACGVPVVATATEGAKVAVAEGETGFLTPPGEAGILADRIREMLGNEALRSRLGAAARKRIVDHFSEDVAGQVFIQAYDDLLSRRGVPPLTDRWGTK